MTYVVDLLRTVVQSVTKLEKPNLLSCQYFGTNFDLVFSKLSKSGQLFIWYLSSRHNLQFLKISWQILNCLLPFSLVNVYDCFDFHAVLHFFNGSSSFFCYRPHTVLLCRTNMETSFVGKNKHQDTFVCIFLLLLSWLKHRFLTYYITTFREGLFKRRWKNMGMIFLHRCATQLLRINW